MPIFLEAHILVFLPPGTVVSALSYHTLGQDSDTLSAGHLLRKSRSAAMSQDCSVTASNTVNIASLKVVQCVRVCVLVWEEYISQLTGVLTWQ